MSAFLLITVLFSAWLSGAWSCRALQGAYGGAYAVSLMFCSIIAGLVLIGYVSQNPIN